MYWSEHDMIHMCYKGATGQQYSAVFKTVLKHEVLFNYCEKSSFAVLVSDGKISKWIINAQLFSKYGKRSQLT